MASPQIENGHTKIANEIMDALCRFHPGGSEGQILWAIIRKTYGWNKAKDQISISQLCNITGLARRTVIYAMKNLESKNMVSVKRHRIDGMSDVNIISFQKDYEKWVVQEIDGSARKCKSYRVTIEKQKQNYKTRVVQEIDGSARNEQRVVQENENDAPFLAPTKDTTTKDTTTKDKSDSDFSIFYAAYPNKKARKKAFEAWNKSKTLPSIGTILKAIETQKQTEGWKKDNGQYIPLPATWINQERWDDVVEIKQEIKKAWNS